ncbi:MULTISPECIES: 4-hydroxy-tetrahydrodipicolinate reductase [unclassified Nitratiruptor]|uniref:4-hydroxy-tetrahydrodipicolinate reductase n=1 Tax=unclassified Nitratiruptor TaxID=2624044 RepID=UPI00191560A4|nr:MULTISPECIES: 4-hydroxy-tetrahydrodipicolinate reductase [unclassified Nitratiruptor]BCD60851.1 4-hydroxy-tetrahydrodipicolinate reductase [Nitratiruptor sp. YY08-10]BCD64783.1 4-hydroxy-tetrahydrodipicolinate reductase [Nitratiruptor sp. YY08-14]
MLNVGIYGGSGRVGSLLIKNLQNDEIARVCVVHVLKGIELEVPGATVTNDIDTLIQKSDVIIDFTLPEGTEALLERLLNHPKPLVSGTTGLSKHQQNLMQTLAQKAPVLYATNMSLGIALLKRLVAMTSEKLRDFDIEIVEMHHRYKKDAPSGTALTLAEYAAKARELDLEKVRVSGRDGNIGERSKDEIGVFALRGGDIVGRHTVGFYNDGEYIELNHTATSRDTFAKGAIKAAKWLVAQEPGLYTIDDCLGL